MFIRSSIVALHITMGEGSTFVNNGTIKIVESCESDTWFATGGLFHRIVNVGDELTIMANVCVYETLPSQMLIE